MNSPLPTLILPDGRLFAGYKPAEDLLKLLESGATLPAVSASKP